MNKGVRRMNWWFLSTKDRKKLDNRKMLNTYYYEEVKNEWYYEDEIIENKIIN